MVVAPLAVLLEPNEPQLPTGEQLQFTPAESLATVAPMVTVLLTTIVEGGAGDRETEIPCGGRLLGVAEETPPQPVSTRKYPHRNDTQTMAESLPVQRGGTCVS